MVVGNCVPASLRKSGLGAFWPSGPSFGSKELKVIINNF